MEKPSLAGHIFHLHWLPFPIYHWLFHTKRMNWWGPSYKNFRFKIDFMNHSPIDSSFTWLRINIEIFKWYAYPVVIQSGYQPNVGLRVCLLHRVIFDNTKWATRQLWLREGKHEWIKD